MKEKMEMQCRSRTLDAPAIQKSTNELIQTVLCSQKISRREWNIKTIRALKADNSRLQRCISILMIIDNHAPNTPQS